jgi:lipopolysaccharide biosynthesis regulator YciM
VRWLPRAFGGDARAPRSGEAALREALLALLDRDVDRAERILVAAARRERRGIGVFLALGKLYRARGEFGRAIRVHQNLLLRADLQPAERVTALADLAEDFRRAGFLRRAIAAYEEVLAHAPRHHEALRQLARLQAGVRDFASARALSKRLAKLEKRDARPEQAALRLEEATAAHAEGRTQDARKAVRHALRLAPELAPAWLLLGEIESELGRTKAAIAAWRRVAALDPRRGRDVHPRLAAAFAALGRARDHEGCLHGLLEAQPEDAGARVALARALAARGAIDESVTELRRVLEREPADLEAQAALGGVLLGGRRDAEALRAYGDLLRVLEGGGASGRESSE